MYPYFQTSKFKISEKNKWFYNPLSEHTYPQNIHWSKVSDFSEKEGDIKFVWEISRFCYLYDIIRYDHHFSLDSSDFVLMKLQIGSHVTLLKMVQIIYQDRKLRLEF